MYGVEREPHYKRVNEKDGMQEFVFGPYLRVGDDEIRRVFVEYVEEVDKVEDEFRVANWTKQKCP